MGIGIEVGDSYREIGSGDFLHCFFSTVSATLEPAGWGSRFPNLMNRLYQGELPAADSRKARSELEAIRRELVVYPPSAVVWDIEDRSQRPLWGDSIAPEITSLANYFVTSEGKDLFDVLFAALDEAARSGQSAVIQ
jgi:2,3-bisphosphoglycerate-dependent phosphoglycerate mutase